MLDADGLCSGLIAKRNNAVRVPVHFIVPLFVVARKSLNLKCLKCLVEKVMGP